MNKDQFTTDFTHTNSHDSQVKESTQTIVNEDLIYETVAKEIENGDVNKGLWTKLFAECGGDNKQTHILYIKQRAQRLISAERMRLEHLERERVAYEKKQSESLRLQKLKLKGSVSGENYS